MAAPEKKLLQLFNQLPPGDRAALTAFAEFLHERADRSGEPTGRSQQPLAEPMPIERPAGETIVGCLKRLAKTYPMLDKTEMLKATSDLVAASVMHGGDTVEAIDELERVFRAHYEQLKNGGGE